MKKMVFVVALLAFALTGSAFAQDPAYRDNIGIYLDEAGTIGCGTAPLSTPTPAYLILTKLTNNEVLGWEAKITFDNMFVLSFTLRGQAVDAGSRENEYVVGFASPLPAVNGNVVVADLSIFLNNANPAYAFADEIYFSLLENGLPAYLDGASGGHSLYPALGGTSDPMFIVNGDCAPVSVEDSSFGSVKSLFR